jgi:hypothetical protein
MSHTFVRKSLGVLLGLTIALPRVSSRGKRWMAYPL